MFDHTCVAHNFSVWPIIGRIKVANGSMQARLTLLSVAELFIVVRHQMLCQHKSHFERNVILQSSFQRQRLVPGRHLSSVDNSVDHRVCEN